MEGLADKDTEVIYNVLYMKELEERLSMLSRASKA